MPGLENALAVLPDGRLASAGADNGAVVRSLYCPHRLRPSPSTDENWLYAVKLDGIQLHEDGTAATRDVTCAAVA